MATTTTRLGLRKPDPDPLTGDYVSAGDDLNDNWDNLDGKMPFTVCTSGTRPGTPYDGQPIIETDTQDAYVWDATAAGWKRIWKGSHTTWWPDEVRVERANGTISLRIREIGDSSYRFQILTSGLLNWGDGSTTDTNLYRSAANVLKTDDSLVIGIDATVTGDLSVGDDTTMTGDLTVGGAFTPSVGFLFKERVIFTANGTFSKGSYTGLRAVRIICVGGGGGSGGVPSTGATQASVSSSGGGGGYSEKWVLAAGLGTSEAVTVGTGGTAGATTPTAGGTGNTSSVGTILTATGGAGGSAGAAAAATLAAQGGGAGGSGTGGDIILQGADGDLGWRWSSTALYAGNGGASGGGWGSTKRPISSTAGGAGSAGHNYGGGAAAGYNYQSQSARAGGAGAQGIVIIDVYV